MMTAPTGYSYQVWSALAAGLKSYNAALQNAATPGSTVSISEAMLTSLLNGSEAINASDTLGAWTSEYMQLIALSTLPLVLDPTSKAYIVARQAAYLGGYLGLAPLVPQPPFGAPSVLVSGAPIIPSAGLVAFYSTFAYETPPTGLVQGNFLADAQFMATAFTNAANAVMVLQGANLTSVYDVATREAACCGMIAQMLQSMTSGPVNAGLPYTNAWNQIVALPAMTTVASLLYSAPFSQQAQQSAVLRYTILVLAQRISQYLLVLRQPQAAQINQTTLRVGESLMDVAARTLGDFERWTEIATLNNLLPPYVGPILSTGIAPWGAQLLLPTPNTGLSAVGTAPSYGTNFLGTDLYFGPINGSMPLWTGDYQTITSYANLAWALGRRLQTTLTTLIYHNTYGSRIPPEVGNVQTGASAGNVAAYGKSAILSDPRVASVPVVSANGSNNAIAFNAQVQPAGFGTALRLNEVISTL